MTAAAPARRPDAAPLRVLIVDDSIVARTMLARMLGARPAFAIAGVARSAAEALMLLERVTVDLIVLDVEMPGMDGLTALPALIAGSGGARVLIVSAQCARGAAASMRALTLGAADTLLKPAAAAFGERFAELLAERLLAVAAAPRAAAGDRRAAPPPARHDPVALLAIGASTGGPHALASFFGALDPAFAAPILVTQHLPASFMPFFADQLRDITGRPVAIARSGMRVEDGAVLIAPGDAHLVLVRTGGIVRAELDRTPAPSGCCPSVDPMLAAVAQVYGAAGIGVVLTGMGRDGLAGATALVQAGGEILAQDAQSAVIWGMPGAVAGAGLAALVAPPATLAARVALRAR